MVRHLRRFQEKFVSFLENFISYRLALHKENRVGNKVKTGGHRQ